MNERVKTNKKKEHSTGKFHFSGKNESEIDS